MAKEVTDNQETIKETVKVIAVKKMYKEKAYYCCMPWSNEARANVNGLEGLSAAKKAQAPFIPTPEENFSINNGDELILTKDKKGEYVIDRDFVLYSLYKVDPNIANSRQEVIATKHLFYMENYEQEAEKSIDIAKLEAKAGSKVIELVTLSDMYDLLFYLGANPVNLTQKRAEAMIYDKVKSRPADILGYFDKLEDSKKLVFVNKLLSYGFIRKNSNNYLQYEDHTLGANEKEAIAYLYDESHSSIFNPLKDMIDKKENNK